jgi:ABC-type oligopeptide transport system substrate-binding subunit
MTKNNNNITIALGIICIILAAGLIATVANYSGRPSTSSLEKQVTSLQNQVTSLQNQVTSLNGLVSDYEEQIDGLTDENNYYASVIALEECIVIIDDETYTHVTDDITVLFDDKLDYAGYIEIQAESTSNTTYIQVSYTYNDLKFNQTITIGNKGTAHFPILPGTIKIALGNTDTEIDTDTIDTTVTMIYIY